MDKEMYVVVADNDCSHAVPSTSRLYYDEKGPIIFETYANEASKENAIKRVASLRGSYGQCRLARLEFVNPLHYGFRDCGVIE